MRRVFPRASRSARCWCLPLAEITWLARGEHGRRVTSGDPWYRPSATRPPPTWADRVAGPELLWLDPRGPAPVVACRCRRPPGGAERDPTPPVAFSRAGMTLTAARSTATWGLDAARSGLVRPPWGRTDPAGRRYRAAVTAASAADGAGAPLGCPRPSAEAVRPAGRHLVAQAPPPRWPHGGRRGPRETPRAAPRRTAGFRARRVPLELGMERGTPSALAATCASTPTSRSPATTSSDPRGRPAAPSASNWQPWNFVVVTDRAAARRTGEGVAAGGGTSPRPRRRSPSWRRRPRTSGSASLLQYDVGQATANMMLTAADLGIGSGHSAVARPGAGPARPRFPRRATSPPT